MPPDIGRQHRRFLDDLVTVVLAEFSLAGVIGCLKQLYWLGLANGKKHSTTGDLCVCGC
jgi:hypothetical protein